MNILIGLALLVLAYLALGVLYSVGAECVALYRRARRK